MNHRLQIAAALIAAVVATPLFAQAAPGTPLYRVTVAVYPGEDPAAAARRLAAMYRGQLETPVDAGGTFTIAVSESGAELLRRDPHVKLVEAVASRTPLLSEPSTDATTSWELGQYKYDGSGNIKQIGTDVFVYDTLGRVTSADAGTGHNQSYTYDGFANVRTITTSGSNVVSRPGVDPLTNRMDKSGADESGHAYNMVASYDLRGNVRSYAGDTFEYDALDVVTKASVGGKWRSYVYTASDERIGTIELTSQNGTAVRSDWTLRDPNGSVLRRFSRESSGAWQWIQDYIYRDGQMLASELPGSPGRRYQYHLDHLGTPRLITGNGGVEISRHTYYAFGTEVPGAAPDGERKQFTGHERDSSTLDYMHARYYFPFAGRFLSVDPTWESADLGKPQTWNRYSYVLNNPVNMTDPDGRVAAPVIWFGRQILSMAARYIGRQAARATVDATVQASVGYMQLRTGQVGPVVIPTALSEGAPTVTWPGWDPTSPPEGFTDWRGKAGAPPGTNAVGAWNNPETGEYLSPDLEHAEPKGPHWTFGDAQGKQWDVYPDGTVVPAGEKPQRKREDTDNEKPLD